MLQTLKLIVGIILVTWGLLDVWKGLRDNDYQRRIHGIVLLILANTF